MTAVLFPRTLRLVERNVLVYRRLWYLLASAAFEPLLYLLSIGIGVGELVGDLPGPGGRPVSYEAFVAPGLMAAAAMNGAILDTTFGFFINFKYGKVYDAALATPLRTSDIARGEVTWALARGGFYAGAFAVAIVVLGLHESAWVWATVPAAVLIGFAFAGAGLAATTYMRSFVDFDLIPLAIMPMFLFAATFFPLDRYPEGIEVLVRLTPLYQGVAIERALTLGDLHWGLLGHAAYLVAMGVIGMRIAGRRLGVLLQP